MAKKDNTKTGRMLMSLLAAKKDFEAVFPKQGQFVSDSMFKSFVEFKNMVYHLRRRGWIKIVAKNSERFIRLTENGELEALLAKARMPRRGRWDGKWRVVMFDIPEESNLKRDMFRHLLKKNGFIKLQASVFINPYPLNREAVEYLKQTGLINYIRILKVEEMDNDAALRKTFQLAAYD